MTAHPDDEPGPFYVAGITFEVWLNNGDVGDEGIAQYEGKWAGPFGTFADAGRALEQCSAHEGTTLVITRYDDDGTMHLYVPEGRRHFYMPPGFELQ